MSRLVAALRSTVARFGHRLEPGSTFAYRRTRVGSRNSITRKEIEREDLKKIESLAPDLGYEPTEQGDFVRTKWPKGATVDWNIEIEEVDDSDETTRQWVLTETVSLPALWLQALVGASLLALVWIYLPASLFFWGLCIGAYLLFGCAFLLYPSPLDTYIDHLRDSKSDLQSTIDPQDYKTSCVSPPLTALFAGLLASGPLFVAGLPLVISEIQSAHTVDFIMVGSWIDILMMGAIWIGVFWLIGLGIGLLVYTYEDDSVRIRVFPFDILSRSKLPTPELSGGYFTLLLAALIPVLALTHSTFLLPTVNRFTTTEMGLYFLTPPTLIIVSILFFLYWWMIRNRQYVYERTIHQLEARQSRWEKIGTLMLLAGTSYFLLYTVFQFFNKYQAYILWPIINRNLLPIVDTPVLVAVLVLALIPTAYFAVGLVYQLFGFTKLIWTTFVRSYPVGKTPRVGATLRVLETDELEAFALGYNAYGYVILSEGILNTLDNENRVVEDEISDLNGELNALIAHEEAHLDPSSNRYWSADAFISLFVPLIGMATLTGKNVIYALLDFRDREECADEYAATQASPDALVSALETLGKETGKVGAPSVMPFVPSATRLTYVPAGRLTSVQAALERYFGMLFGSFALARAHPSLLERISRYEEEIE